MFVDPEEIFLDSQNLPDFNTQQFEGQFERPIARRSLIGIGVLLALVMILFSGRLWKLQIAEGETYRKQSENNSLDSEPIFAPRGTILDRNGIKLAWNNATTEERPWGERGYIAADGFAHVLGYVGYPAKDKSGNYWQKVVSGRDGVEKYYNSLLAGTNGSHLIEKDISGVVQDGAIVNQPVAGTNLTLTIDSRLQSKMYSVLSEYSRMHGYRSASAVMMDVTNGEVIVLTNYPEYDPQTISDGANTAAIRGYLNSSATPLLNRAIAGLFTPGSIVKPYVALEALRAGVVTPNTLICSCGSITIPNPYDPSKPSIFRDYNPNNGIVDIRKALAVSSNIFFMEVTGGYRDQKGIGIAALGTALKRFGLTEKTGIDLLGERSGTVPSPEWKAAKFDGEAWRVGDTYNTSIGQYGVQVTPIEMARSLSAIARMGILVTPHVLKDPQPKNLSEKKVPDVSEKEYRVVQEGMRQGATIGTGKILATLPFTAASKTGTAQVGANAKFINAWMNAYFPYEQPHYALVIVMEHGPQAGIGATQRVAKDFLDWVALNAPEYTK